MEAHLLIGGLVELNLSFAIWMYFCMWGDENWTTRSLEVGGFWRRELVSYRRRDAGTPLVFGRAWFRIWCSSCAGVGREGSSFRFTLFERFFFSSWRPLARKRGIIWFWRIERWRYGRLVIIFESAFLRNWGYWVGDCWCRFPLWRIFIRGHLEVILSWDCIQEAQNYFVAYRIWKEAAAKRKTRCKLS